MEEREQQIVYEALESLTHAQLIQLWKRLGIEFASDYPESSHYSLDRIWLIGPILADATLSELKKALHDMKSDAWQ
ncbi:MAG: hypothetical protein KGH79_02810 [Patescibacteria group bacterium]|nr:hypothetical protein [Patescibacteria group bacterium]